MTSGCFKQIWSLARDRGEYGGEIESLCGVAVLVMATMMNRSFVMITFSSSQQEMVRGVVNYYLQFILPEVLPDGFPPKKRSQKSTRHAHSADSPNALLAQLPDGATCAPAPTSSREHSLLCVYHTRRSPFSILPFAHLQMHPQSPTSVLLQSAQILRRRGQCQDKRKIVGRVCARRVREQLYRITACRQN